MLKKSSDGLTQDVNDSRTKDDLVWGDVERLHRSYTRVKTGVEPGTWIYGTCSMVKCLCMHAVQVRTISRQTTRCIGLVYIWI